VLEQMLLSNESIQLRLVELRRHGGNAAAPTSRAADAR
jgi:hypothetical protein